VSQSLEVAISEEDTKLAEKKLDETLAVNKEINIHLKPVEITGNRQ